MRRSERAITATDEILAVLEKCPVLHLGLCDGDKPYVVPLNFGWEAAGDKLLLYFHCAGEGKKLEIIARNPSAFFAAECSCEAVGGGQACSWTARYESVMGEGTVTPVEDEAEKIRGLDLLMRRAGFGGKPEYSPGALARVTVLRMEVTSLSGKRNLG